LPVGGGQFLHGDGFRFMDGEPATILGPFPHEPVVFPVTGLGAVGAELMVLAVERNDRLPAGAVFPVLGKGIGETWRGANPRCRDCKTVCTVLAGRIRAALPTPGRYRKCLIRLDLEKGVDEGT
jgi:hypothetical protein